MILNYIKFKKFIFIILLILIIDICSCLLYFQYVTKQIYIQNNKFSKVDVAAVLFSGFAKNGTYINKETLRRINFTIKLYNLGYIKNIICIGGNRTNKKFSGAHLMKQKLIQLGIPSEIIYKENKSRDTYTNIKYLLVLIKNNHWKKIGLISSPLHIFRIKVLQIEKNIDIKFFPYNYKKTPPPIRLVTLWEQIHHEWLALAMWKILPLSFYEKLIKFIRR